MALTGGEEDQLRRLRFTDPAVEEAFRADYAVRSLRYVRLMTVLMLVLVVVGGLLYAELPPEIVPRLLLLRYGLTLPLVLIGLGLTYWRGFPRAMQPALAAMLLGFGATLLLSRVARAQSPELAEAAYVASDPVLFVLSVYVLSRLRLLSAVLVCAVFVASYLLLASRSLLPEPAWVRLSYDLFLANLLGLSAGLALERSVRRDFLQQRRIREEQERADALLLNILPREIAARLKADERTIADHHDEVTILFADISGFTRLSEAMGPRDLVHLLNELFSAFDGMAERHGLEKIKTIGDSYMAAAGLPHPRPDHARAAAEMALEMQRLTAAFGRRRGLALTLRVGINSGPVVAGVIGVRKFSYDLWGDAVNVASRMESHGPEEGGIQVTEATRDRLGEAFAFAPRGPIAVKGKGEMTVYLLLGPRTPSPKGPTPARTDTMAV